MKKFLLFIFGLFLFVGIHSQTPVAPAGSGTTGDPYQIATLDNLCWMSQNSAEWTKYFIQTADIDAASTSTWNSGAGWAPIGYANSEIDYLAFAGHYNGKGHIISNLFINRPASNTVAFFGLLYGADIDSLGIENANITGGGEMTGCLSGMVVSTVIMYCHSSGTVTGVSAVGGLVGGLGDNSAVVYCYSNCIVSGSEDNIGGLVGKNQWWVMSCYSTGPVSGKAAVGGLVGQNDEGSYQAYIDSSYATGAVTAIGSETFASIGGLVGENKDSAIIASCYSTGNVTGSAYSDFVGGFVGNNGGQIVGCFSYSDVSARGCVGGLVGNNYPPALISHCYTRGDVSGSENNVGGLVGRNTADVEISYSTGVVNSSGGCFGGLLGSNEDAGDVTNCFWDTQTSGTSNGCGFLGSSTFDASGKITVEMKTQTTFTDAGWDFVGETINGTNDIWQISASINDGYPCFIGQDPSAGMQEKKEIFFSVYPNPASDFVLFNLDINTEPGCTLSVYDISGSLIRSEIISHNSQQINISDFSKGLYFFEITSGNQIQTQKLIIQK